MKKSQRANASRTGEAKNQMVKTSPVNEDKSDGEYKSNSGYNSTGESKLDGKSRCKHGCEYKATIWVSNLC